MLDNKRPLKWEELNAQFFGETEDERKSPETVHTKKSDSDHLYFLQQDSESNSSLPSFEELANFSDILAEDQFSGLKADVVNNLVDGKDNRTLSPPIEDILTGDSKTPVKDEEESAKSDKDNINTGTSAKHYKEKITKTTRAYKIVRVISNILFSFITIFIIVSIAVSALSNNTDKKIWGYRIYTVLTNTMEDTYRPGDLLFVKEVSVSAIEKEDVIVYTPGQSAENYLTHRVAEVLPNYRDSEYTGFRIKSNSNSANNSWVVHEDKVKGVATISIPKGGWIISYVRENFWLIALMIGLITILLILLRRLLKATYSY